MPDKITAKAPWVKNLGDIPAHLDYFQGSMYDMLKSVADKYPNNIAMDFMGRSTTYRQLLEHVERCAKALKTIGIRENDCVTIAMPNCPQAIAMFYAINMVGAYRQHGPSPVQRKGNRILSERIQQRDGNHAGSVLS